MTGRRVHNSKSILDEKIELTPEQQKFIDGLPHFKKQKEAVAAMGEVLEILKLDKFIDEQEEWAHKSSLVEITGQEMVQVIEWLKELQELKKNEILKNKG